MLRSASNAPTYIFCRTALLMLIVFSTAFRGFSTEHKPLCSNGDNSFSTILSGGASVELGPQKSTGFAARACEATLGWHETKLEVAHNAAEIDLDLFGTELKGIGPVAAFQVKNSAEQCCRSYRIYSIAGAPRLLRTIDGGFFSAKDFYLDRRVDIWTEDAASINGMEGLIPDQIEFLPTLVLRFEDNRLLDATAEYADYFDQVIARITAQIDPTALAAFRQSDGKVAFSVNEVEKFARLQKVKIQVFQIVWAYLYSGREQQAWSSLSQMWPAADLERIRSIIIHARQNGILSQVDGQSTPAAKHKKAEIFEFRENAIHRAVPIMMWTPQLGSRMTQRLSGWDVTLMLIIDSAGKVYSARLKNSKLALIENSRDLLDVVRQWKFVPAMKKGHPVASEFETTIALKQ